MKVDELLPEYRDRVWRDRDGDDWKFIDGTWHYRRPGVGSFSGLDEDEWESTESDEQPDYGPFDLVS